MRGVLIFYYLGGAGGKFIANCLSYSGQVAFSDYDIALKQDINKYHTTLLTTIPEDKKDRTWMFREKGCWQLFGPGVGAIKNHWQITQDAPLNDLTKLGNQWLPIMAHFKYEVSNIQEYFKDVPQRFIIVNADPVFIDRAIRLKWENPAHCLDLDRYDEFQQEIKSMSADYCFDNWNPLAPGAQERIVEFARWLGIDLDLNSQQAQEYINKYIAFHV
jgi:hypothetical protein